MASLMDWELQSRRMLFVNLAPDMCTKFDDISLNDISLAFGGLFLEGLLVTTLDVLNESMVRKSVDHRWKVCLFPQHCCETIWNMIQERLNWNLIIESGSVCKTQLYGDLCRNLSTWNNSCDKDSHPW